MRCHPSPKTASELKNVKHAEPPCDFWYHMGTHRISHDISLEYTNPKRPRVAHDLYARTAGQTRKIMEKKLVKKFSARHHWCSWRTGLEKKERERTATFSLRRKGVGVEWKDKIKTTRTRNVNYTENTQREEKRNRKLGLCQTQAILICSEKCVEEKKLH